MRILLTAAALCLAPLVAYADMTSDQVLREKRYAESFGDDVAGAYKCGHRVEAERYMKYLIQYIEQCGAASRQQIDEITHLYKSAEPAACAEVSLGAMDAMATSNAAVIATGCHW